MTRWVYFLKQGTAESPTNIDKPDYWWIISRQSKKNASAQLPCFIGDLRCD
jgi:hypothetical protein